MWTGLGYLGTQKAVTADITALRANEAENRDCVT